MEKDFDGFEQALVEYGPFCVYFAAAYLYKWLVK